MRVLERLCALDEDPVGGADTGADHHGGWRREAYAEGRVDILLFLLNRYHRIVLWIMEVLLRLKGVEWSSVYISCRRESRGRESRPLNIPDQ